MVFAVVSIGGGESFLSQHRVDGQVVDCEVLHSDFFLLGDDKVCSEKKAGDG